MELLLLLPELNSQNPFLSWRRNFVLSCQILTLVCRSVFLLLTRSALLACNLVLLNSNVTGLLTRHCTGWHSPLLLDTTWYWVLPKGGMRDIKVFSGLWLQFLMLPRNFILYFFRFYLRPLTCFGSATDHHLLFKTLTRTRVNDRGLYSSESDLLLQGHGAWRKRLRNLNLFFAISARLLI